MKKRKKLRLYLESSTINMYFQDDAPYLQELTRRFWKRVLPRFDGFISDTILDEIGATPEETLREALEKLILDFKVIGTNEEIIRLSQVYLSFRRMPRADALHLAAASMGGMNFLVTWNLRHLYKLGTQEMVREVNTIWRLPVPMIVTPGDSFKEED